jgi:hypothetical protein
MLYIILHILIIYIPFFQTFFDTTAIGLADWALIIAIGSSPVILDEIQIFIAGKIPQLH